MTQRRNQDYARTLPRPLPAEVTRTALHERIARADNAGLIVVAAPSGYGKTTLLGQIARASNHAAWLTLSDRHADLKSLTDALMASITQAVKEATFGRVRKAVAEGAQVAALATLFARELDELAVNITILVDQTHLLGDDALSWLELFALALGEGHQLIYCAYDLASERLAVPLASGSALLFTASDLAFSEDESRAYLDARGSSADAFKMHRELEGWPAGVGLAAAGVGHVLSHDELLRAAFDRLPRDVREALPEASVLEVWREADAVQLGCDLPKGWLKEARRAGLPMTPLNTKAYKPHTLVLEMLDQELQAYAKRYAKLHSIAGSFAQRSDDLISSLKHFQKAGLAAEAFEVTEILLPRLYKRGEYKLTCQLLEPLEKFGLPPKLLSAYATALVSTGAIAHGEKILIKLQHRDDCDPIVFFNLGIIASIRGESSNQLNLAEQGLARAEDQITRIYLQKQKIAAFIELGNFQKALQLTLDSLEVIEVTGSRVLIAWFLIELQHIYRHLKQYESCEQAIKQARAIYKDLYLSHSRNSFHLIQCQANLYLIQNRISEALEVLENSLPAAEREQSTIIPSLFDIYADTLVRQTKCLEAVDFYQRAAQIFRSHGETSALRSTLYKLSGSAHLAEQPIIARDAIGEALGIPESEKISGQGYSEFFGAMHAFFNFDLQNAQIKFAEASHLLNNEEYIVRTHAYQLEIARRRGEVSKKDFNRFVENLNAFGSDDVLWIDAKPLRLLYARYVKDNWLAERFVPYTRPHAALDTEVITRPTLLLQTLNNIHISLNYKTIKLPFIKAAELLIWLTVNGPASREKIIDALWDGSNDPKHIEYGKLALRRLRTALADHVPFNPLVYAERQYRLADTLEIKLDVRETLKAFETGDDAARRKALERYDGTFLPGVTSGWVELMRVELHDAALATATGLGASYEHSDVPLALWAYRRAVEIEPLFLDGHRALVQLLQANGDQVGARLAYQTYLRVLTTEYGETSTLTFDDLLHETRSKHLN